MAIATYHFSINTNNKKTQVYLRVTCNRHKCEYATGVFLDRNDWNPKSETIRKGKEDSAILNNRLSKLKANAQKAEDYLKQNNKEITAKNIVGTFKKLESNTLETNFSFIRYAEKYVLRTYEKSYWTSTKQNTLLNKLKCFLAHKTIKKGMRGKEFNDYVATLDVELEFKDITISFLNDFIQYLQMIPNGNNPKVKLNANTIKKNIEVFRTIYRKGVLELEEKGLVLSSNPFDRLKLDKVDVIKKEKLTDDEIERLKKLNLCENTRMWDTRNCFLFALYCAGMRIGDAITMRANNIHKMTDDSFRLVYVMGKTHKYMNIELMPDALKILSYYVDLDNLTSNFIFPFFKENSVFANAKDNDEIKAMSADMQKKFKKQISAKVSLMNKNLAKLSSMAGIDKKITTHVARHSFADKARKQETATTDIKALLGHSNIKITENYLNTLDLESQDKTLEKVFAPKNDTHKKDLLARLGNLDDATLEKLLKQVE